MGHMGASYYTYIIVYPSFIYIAYEKYRDRDRVSPRKTYTIPPHTMLTTLRNATAVPPRPEGERDAA